MGVVTAQTIISHLVPMFGTIPNQLHNLLQKVCRGDFWYFCTASYADPACAVWSMMKNHDPRPAVVRIRPHGVDQTPPFRVLVPPHRAVIYLALARVPVEF